MTHTSRRLRAGLGPLKIVARLGVASLAAVLVAGLVTPTTATGAPSERRAAAFKPTLKADSAQVVAGRRLVLSGKVKPARPGETVVLQKRVGDKKKWVVEARLRMSRTGSFTYRDKPNAPGVRHYRVVVPKVGRVKAGVSKQVKVTVYRWQRLEWKDRRTAEATYYGTKNLTIDGKKFDYALSGSTYYNEGFIDWNLGRECLKVRARYGNGDDSDDLAVAHISMDADGESIYTKSFALTESEQRTLDIAGVFRLGFHWTSTNPEGTPQDQGGAAAAFVEPEVLCAF